MVYLIVYADNVVRQDIPTLPKKQKGQIKKAIEERLTVDPIGLGKPLRYSLLGCRRLRVGDWRIIYRVMGQSVQIIKIGNRKDVYEC